MSVVLADSIKIGSLVIIPLAAPSMVTVILNGTTITATTLFKSAHPLMAAEHGGTSRRQSTRLQGSAAIHLFNQTARSLYLSVMPTRRSSKYLPLSMAEPTGVSPIQ